LAPPCSCPVGTGFGFLFARLLARDRVTPYLMIGKIFSPARYKAMERLLEETDYRYLSTQPGFGRQLETSFAIEESTFFAII